jgi:hypothetical protein
MHKFTLFFWCLKVSVLHFSCFAEAMHQTACCLFVGTGESGNASLHSFWQVKSEQDARQCPTTNTRCTCEKDMLAFGLFEEN